MIIICDMYIVWDIYKYENEVNDILLENINVKIVLFLFFLW